MFIRSCGLEVCVENLLGVLSDDEHATRKSGDGGWEMGSFSVLHTQLIPVHVLDFLSNGVETSNRKAKDAFYV